jgi:Tfp pilus assembly pilus retraction ATPase PilT
MDHARTRDPFPYESNAALLRQILVPHALNQTQWDSEVQRWRSEGHSASLLEWLIESSGILEERILSCIQDQTGANLVTGLDPIESGNHDPESALLARHGFLELPPLDGKRRLAGGPVPGPDLSHYFGKRAHEWEWVLVPPIRNNLQAKVLVEESTEPPGNYGQQAWLRELVFSAWSKGAQDLHFEQSGTQLQVRTHTGGAMRTIGTWLDGRASAIVRLLESWANLPQGNGRIPRDGHIQIQSATESLELRVSILPTVDGQSIVLRSPSSTLTFSGLEDLGMPPELATRIIDSILYDPGLILISGTTGSGKTTTLYGILHELKSYNLKILTIEDPVEQVIPFSVQSAVDEDREWTFDSAIRAYLRQDPDLIMIGEIRDRKSAEAACRAALTGHAVVSTVHAIDHDSALQRMHGWGIERNTLKELVLGILSQSLTNHPNTDSLVAHFDWFKP